MTDRWDRLYAQADAAPPPARVLAEHSHLLPRAGRALDLACGLGGNALHLARHGLTVDAWDRSTVAVRRLNHWAREEGLAVRAEARDLIGVELPVARYHVIVVAHFLLRPLLAQLPAALAPGGLLFYQTFSQALPGWRRGPANPAMRLTPGELLRACAGLEILYYREGGTAPLDERGSQELAAIVARRGV